MSVVEIFVLCFTVGIAGALFAFNTNPKVKPKTHLIGSIMLLLGSLGFLVISIYSIDSFKPMNYEDTFGEVNSPKAGLIVFLINNWPYIFSFLGILWMIVAFIHLYYNATTK